MGVYIKKRLFHFLPLLIGITFIGFVIVQLAPGDYYTRLRADPQISPALVEQLRQQFGLDQPLLIQYLKWLYNAIRLDFGISLSFKIPVTTLIQQRLFNTLALSLLAIFITWCIVIPIGVFCAVKQYSIFDKLITGVSFVLLCIPTFLIALIFMLIAIHTGWSVGGTGSLHEYIEEQSLFNKVVDYLRYIMLPTTVLVIASLPSLLRLMKANMLEVLGHQFILALKARGIKSRTIRYKHALRNAINPLITIFGYQLSEVLSGAALVEIITRWPGLGRLMLEAFKMQDLYVIMAALTISGILLILCNLLADILLAIADPTIREFKKTPV